VPLAAALDRPTRQFGEPNPYPAVLVADGDRMGETLSRLISADEHRTFSRELSRFAGEARRIVNDHGGVLVYSGGDDVLAFVPVDRCLECARELYDKFGEMMDALVAKLNAGRRERLDAKMTLSVGIAVAHFLDNREDLLEYGRTAEKHAKNGEPVRNGLAVHLQKRGGGPMRVREQWTEKGLDARLAELADLLRAGAIPNRIAYDLARLAEVYAGWPLETAANAIRQDAYRIIAAKQPCGAEKRMDHVRNLIAQRVRDADSLRGFANELLIARQLAVAFRQAARETANDRQEAAAS
jgi:CRISPR-associated protein Cmr2